MADKIVVSGTGCISIGGYLNNLKVGDQTVANVLLDHLGVTTEAQLVEIIGKLTLIIEPIEESLSVKEEA